jgi:hypothetical protein
MSSPASDRLRMGSATAGTIAGLTLTVTEMTKL